MKIEKDGNMYCVKADNFVDLQESSDYFFIDEAEYQAFLSTAHEAGRAEANKKIKLLLKSGHDLPWYDEHMWWWSTMKEDGSAETFEDAVDAMLNDLDLLSQPPE